MTGTLCSSPQKSRWLWSHPTFPRQPPEMTPAPVEQLPEGSSTKEGPRGRAGPGTSLHHPGCPSSWSTSLPAEPSLGLQLSHPELLSSSDSVLCYQNRGFLPGTVNNSSKQCLVTPKPEDFPEPGLDPTVLCGVCGQRAPALTFWGLIAPGEKPAARLNLTESCTEQRGQLNFRG